MFLDLLQNIFIENVWILEQRPIWYILWEFILETFPSFPVSGPFLPDVPGFQNSVECISISKAIFLYTRAQRHVHNSSDVFCFICSCNAPEPFKPFSYLAVGVSGGSDSLLEREPTRSNDRGLLSYNNYIYKCSPFSPLLHFQSISMAFLPSYSAPLFDHMPITPYDFNLLTFLGFSLRWLSLSLSPYSLISYHVYLIHSAQPS